MSNELVGYSRAGDAFHYRWAARRCLRMIYPNSTMLSVFVEGSNEINKDGEYVIDVAEYHEINKERHIDYYQLKHSTVRVESPFTLSDLKATIEGFAKRFIQHYGTKTIPQDAGKITFIILTNRLVAADLVNNVEKLSIGDIVEDRFLKTIESYTVLSGDQLRLFCENLKFQVVKENYLGQKDELMAEISQLLASHVNTPQLESVIAMVSDKALPDADHKIVREQVLQKFGITSEKELYPAPPQWETDAIIIPRKQYEDLKDKILKKPGPFIIHAAGGVGKSVFCRYLAADLENGSLAIAYDCFGAGDYRNRSTLRHGHRNALVQICNELAARGLCSPLLLQNDSDEQITRAFIQRAEGSLTMLKSGFPEAKLLLIVDAADNAEMGAQEFNQNCFAHEILREKYPDDVRLVMLCRTERIQLLQPKSNVIQLPLLPFSEEESTTNLLQWFPEANSLDGKEFHRLTNANPRVQANALDKNAASVSDLLSSLGPSPVTVEDLIEKQLQYAIDRLKDSLPVAYQKNIYEISTGLSSLPPHIPLDVLAAASGVGVEQIKSFVSDIGRSLWLSDESVQFRDEPTETWFRTNFATNADGYKAYIGKLEPLADGSTYIAECLPMLYLQAGEYDKLLSIALSDDFLPKNNPIDQRNVRVYRLKFAFQAALRLSKLDHAIKVAMRAGEEIAGDQRQSSLLKQNIDLLATLQSRDKVQQIAYRRSLGGGWPGSENIYSACALSFIPEFKGEARSYARSAQNWLGIYFDEVREKQKAVTEKHERVENNVQNEDIFELAFAILNIADSSACFKFLRSLKPVSSVAHILGMVTNRLIDHGRFAEVSELLKASVTIPHFFVTIVDNLLEVGHIAPAEGLEEVLTLLAHKKTRIEIKAHYSHDHSPVLRILSFLEVCLHHGLSSILIRRVLRHYAPKRIAKEELNFHNSTLRNSFFRALAIRSVIDEDFELVIEDLLPEQPAAKDKSKRTEDELKEYKQVILGLFPWFKLRADIIARVTIDLLPMAKLAQQASNSATSSRYQTYDFIPGELVALRIAVIAVCHDATPIEVENFVAEHIKSAKDFHIGQQLNLTRIVFRNQHLDHIKSSIEQYTRKDMVSFNDDGPEEMSDRYVKLARAVLNRSVEDAMVYFDEAITAVSKFGDELLFRWHAIASIANRATTTDGTLDELAYRFIRCAEVVGKNAREKHWDRDEALQICIRLSPNVGISALSRWRDRQIGYYEYLLGSALRELMQLNLVPADISWGVAKMRGLSVDMDFVALHLNQPGTTVSTKQRIFDDALISISKQGYLNHFWREINETATRHHLKIIDEIKALFDYKRAEPETDEKVAVIREELEMDWPSIFADVQLTTVEGLESAYDRFHAIVPHRSHDQFQNFCRQLFDRCQEADIFMLIDAYLSSEFVYYSEAPFFFTEMPDEWRSKVSFKKRWPEILKALGSQFAYELHAHYSFRHFCRDLNLDDSEKDILRSGIFERFSQSGDDQNAEFFFDFVWLASSTIDNAQAGHLLDYSLARFEIQIDDDFGDGPWCDWLIPHGNISQHIGGFIWSALGSPWTSSRWNVVHALYSLAAAGADQVFDDIFERAKKGTVDYFGSKEFEYYNLHARLYLLIACAKIALDYPAFLKKYHPVFIAYALEPHALIQKMSADIINRLNKYDSGIYEESVLTTVNAEISSPFKIEKTSYNHHNDSYWHQSGQEAVDGEFFFGIDFPQYWYQPLGGVFGVVRDQVCDLAKNVVLNEWQVKDLNGYQNDKRRSLWNSHGEERATWHDHGGYPKADSLDFYHSYHAMFVVAANLLKYTPITQRRDETKNPWEEWMGYHSLTFDDGRWLSDLRGNAPVQRPIWTAGTSDGKWSDEIQNVDILSSIMTDTDEGEQWLFIDGGWSEIDNSRKESYRISTALVNPHTSNALLNALASCADPWDYKIPEYGEGDHEYKSGLFNMRGWLYSPYLTRGIDQFDGEANHITHSYGLVGEGFQKLLGLKTLNHEKSWFVNTVEKPVFLSEIYCTPLKEYGDEEPTQSGNRMKGSISYLLEVCTRLNSDIIFEVQLSRSFTYRTGSDNNRKEKYLLFLLKSDGTIRTTEKSFKIR
jgi:hypothetical protein